MTCCTLPGFKLHLHLSSAPLRILPKLITVHTSTCTRLVYHCHATQWNSRSQRHRCPGSLRLSSRLEARRRNEAMLVPCPQEEKGRFGHSARCIKRWERLGSSLTECVGVGVGKRSMAAAWHGGMIASNGRLERCPLADAATGMTCIASGQRKVQGCCQAP